MWRVSDIYVARFRHGRGVLSAHKRNTIEWEVNANHRCLSPTFVFTDLSHHRMCRPACGGSSFG